MKHVKKEKALVQSEVFVGLDPKAGPFFRQFVERLSQAITQGQAPPGAQLPTHRQLAESLRIAVATVARAYAEAERLGLVDARVGRGTFIAQRPGEAATADEGPLSLSANVPPYRLARPFLREALIATAADPGLDTLCGYPPTGGDQVAREAVARWLKQTSALADAGAEDLILCSGVMSALHLVLNHLHRPGEAVLCESATFFGIRDVARQLELRLVPVSMDGHGIRPEALEAAARSSGARSVVLTPTLQNPTALTYPRERREVIAQTCTQLGLNIIEDDIYGALTWPEQPLPAFQVLAPERTFYLGGVSKILLPGLRVGWICCPPQHRASLRDLIWTTSIGSPQIGHRLFAQMVMADQAARLAALVRDEVRERGRLTIERLGVWLSPDSPPMSLHYWIPCPMEQARQIHADCAARGLTLTPPELPVIDADNVSGMRICIGAPATRQRLAAALEVLAGALETPGGLSGRPVV